MAVSKRLLIIGLLRAPKETQRGFADVTPVALKETVQAEFEKTKAAGYNLDISLCDDQRFDEALREIKSKLQAEKYDGISIGNGTRGTHQFTTFFEDLVNTCREVQPGTRLCFNSHPGDLYQAIVRNFGESGFKS